MNSYEDLYEFDHILYDGEAECSTCKFKKPARSKHCRVCDVCISRQDHHCIWINQCVGEKNYRWFLFYLFSHAVLLAYCAICLLLIICSMIKQKHLFNQVFVNKATGRRVKATYYYVFQYILSQYPSLSGLLFLTAIMAVAVILFLCMHIYQMRRNITSNEMAKWGYIKQYYIQKEKKRLLPTLSEFDQKLLNCRDCMTCYCYDFYYAEVPHNRYIYIYL